MQHPFPANPKPQTRLCHPVTGLTCFGIVPRMVFNRVEWPRGEIVLPYGHRAFGAVHIFARHSAGMAKKGFLSIEQTPNFVASIIRPFAPVYLEGGTVRERLAVVQAVSGTVILELRTPDAMPAYYSVVTAFLPSTGHGKRIGQLDDPQ